MRPVNRVESVVQAIGTDGGVHQPGRLAADIMPIVSVVPIYDTKGNLVGNSPRTSFTISIDTADGGTLSYQCHMQLIDNPSVPTSNRIAISYGGTSITDGCQPTTFVEYFTRMAELHSQIALDCGQFVPGPGLDPHVGFGMMLPSGGSTITCECDLYPYLGTHIWISSIRDPSRPGDSSDILNDGGLPDTLVFNQVAEVRTFLEARMHLIADAQQSPQGDQLVLSYRRVGYDNRIVFSVPYTVNVKEYSVADGSISSSVAGLMLSGFMTGDGKIRMSGQFGSFCYYPIDRLLEVEQGIQAIGDSNAILIRRNGPGTPLIYLIMEGSSRITFTELIDANRQVVANIFIDPTNGHTWLQGFSVLGEQGIRVQKNIDLGLPNFALSPAMVNILQSLAYSISGYVNVKIMDSISMQSGDTQFDIKVSFTGQAYRISNDIHLVFTVHPEIDPTAIYGVEYYQSNENDLVRRYLNDDGLSQSFKVDSSTVQSLHFSQWLRANQITYADLTWTQAYQDFILFLRGQVTDKWDPSLLSTGS